MIKPDYQDGSIVNLMASIAHGRGGKSPYEAVSWLDPQLITSARNVALVIIDGLGYDYLVKHAPHRHPELQGKLTSVFPSSTAPAISSLVTGVAPQQHGVTGWFMQLRELGSVGVILPYRPRFSTTPFNPEQLPVGELLGHPSLFDGLAVQGFYLMHQHLVDSAYSQMAAGSAKRCEYQGLSDLFQSLAEIVHKHQQPKYIYAYWPMFDALAHRYGIDSDPVLDHFQHIDQELQHCIEALSGSDTLLLVTADHGFIDTSAEHTLQLEDYPEIQQCLSAPLCGEPRVGYCYVQQHQQANFEKYVSEQLEHAVTLHPADDLVAANWFGLGEPTARLQARIGDYILICKEDYVIKDRLPMEQPWQNIGVHGGTSEREMYVPLLAISC